MESLEHTKLVKLLKEDAITRIPNGCSSLLISDSDDQKPPTLFNSVPDIFYEDTSLILIGEAKSTFDYSTKRSISQYLDYLNYIHGKNGFIIFASRWQVIKSFKELINFLIKKNKFHLVNKPIFINGDLIE